jgi:hypothetical protein
VDASITPEVIMSSDFVADAEQGFVKFSGTSADRSDRSVSVVNQVRASGHHWAVSYPRGKRPRQVRDGAIMFIGRLVAEPNDTMIYGRAVGMQHVPGRDDATPEEIAERPWKTNWPHYVRVHHSEFLAGNIGDGVPLSELMDALGADAFAPTQRNARRGTGNLDPRKAYRRQAAVELSREGMAWLNERLEQAFARHGKIPAAELESLGAPGRPFEPENPE